MAAGKQAEIYLFFYRKGKYALAQFCIQHEQPIGIFTYQFKLVHQGASRIFLFNLFRHEPLQEDVSSMVPFVLGKVDQVIDQSCNFLFMGQDIFYRIQG